MKKLLFSLAAIALGSQLRAQTVVDIIVNSPNHNTLEAAVTAANLGGTLSGTGPFTVFAPTDAAFAALPDGVLDALLADPSGDLTEVLTYHVTSGTVLSSALSDGQQVPMLFGQNAVISINGSEVRVNNAVVTVTDIAASNGVVHVIDAVLVPSVWNVVVNSPVHTTLQTAIETASLDPVLTFSGPFTLFAPTDAAFSAIPTDDLAAILADPAGLLTTILTYHVVSGSTLAADLSDGMEITTLQGNTVTVTINGSGVFINDAQVVVTDIPAYNGVVHVIDAVLVPEIAFTSVMDIISGSADHNTLEAAIGAAGLTATLDTDGSYTVFAPTDAAFAALPAGTVESLLNNIPVLTDILLYHVAGSELASTDLSNGQMITMLNNGAVTVTINSEGVFINNAKVTVADLAADNGIVHVIDAVLLPAPPADMAFVQIIHNAADAALDTVDVWVNGDLFLNDVAFRASTQLLPVPAGAQVNIGLAPSNSTNAGDAVFNASATFAAGNHIVVANGIYSSTGYNPAPAVGLDIFNDARTTSQNPAQTDVLVYHGATDAPEVDVLVTAPASLTLVDNLQYREFSGYLGVDALDYVLGIAPSAGSPILLSYLAPLQTLNTSGAAITVLASGFLTPENNSGGAPFGLYYTTALGGALQPLPISTGIAQAESTTSFVLAPNPTDGLIRLETSNTVASWVRVMDLNGKVILQQNVQGQTSTLDLSALESGMYLVELSNTQGRQIQRIAVR